MNADSAEKISKLAKQMKDLHLAATMEEAYERAKQIILSTAKEGEKSIKEMFDDFQREKNKGGEEQVFVEEFAAEKTMPVETEQGISEEPPEKAENTGTKQEAQS